MRAALALALALSAGPALAQEAFTLGNPDRRLWQTQQADTWGGGPTRLVCFHQVCPRGTAVSAQTAQGPARRPDAATLRRISQQDLPRQIAGWGGTAPRLSTTTTSGWPAVRGTFEANGQPVAILQVHMDGAVVTLTGVSSDPAFAPRGLDAVVRASRFARP